MPADATLAPALVPRPPHRSQSQSSARVSGPSLPASVAARRAREGRGRGRPFETPRHPVASGSPLKTPCCGSPLPALADTPCRSLSSSCGSAHYAAAADASPHVRAAPLLATPGPAKTRRSRVSFAGSPLNTAVDITPYSQVYGVHPQLFDFDSRGAMELRVHAVGRLSSETSKHISPQLSPEKLQVLRRPPPNPLADERLVQLPVQAASSSATPFPGDLSPLDIRPSSARKVAVTVPAAEGHGDKPLSAELCWPRAKLRGRIETAPHLQSVGRAGHMRPVGRKLSYDMHDVGGGTGDAGHASISRVEPLRFSLCNRAFQVLRT